ncbi:MAG: hypothetical protein FD126_1243 [Elusimicrobia bacterium]|nr:MAG: hypothetical protein FD126_1243 [Elusimicrobiota bacterium]
MGQSVGDQLKESAALLRGPSNQSSSVGRMVKQALQESRMVGLRALPLIREACQGALTGYCLAGGELPAGSASAVRAVAEWSSNAGIDPMEALMSAVEGIAIGLKGLPPADLVAISERLDAEFTGSGEHFNEVCYRVR